MYAGQVMEICDAGELEQAEHPYTQGLLSCLPQVGGGRRELAVLERDPAWSEVQAKSSD